MATKDDMEKMIKRKSEKDNWEVDEIIKQI